jgi:Ca2+-binding EF-hand superfamily protein
VALVLAWLPLVALGQDSSQLERYQRRLEEWFQQLDRNRDGRLTRDEVRGHPYLEMNFERLDRKGRGQLLPADLAPARLHFLGERLRRKFQEADRSGDGRLTPTEAEAIPWLFRRWREADLDGDGRVTLEEFWQLRRRLAPRP